MPGKPAAAAVKGGKGRFSHRPKTAGARPRRSGGPVLRPRTARAPPPPPPRQLQHQLPREAHHVDPPHLLGAVRGLGFGAGGAKWGAPRPPRAARARGLPRGRPRLSEGGKGPLVGPTADQGSAEKPPPAWTPNRDRPRAPLPTLAAGGPAAQAACHLTRPPPHPPCPWGLEFRFPGLTFSRAVRAILLRDASLARRRALRGRAVTAVCVGHSPRRRVRTGTRAGASLGRALWAPPPPRHSPRVVNQRDGGPRLDVAVPVGRGTRGRRRRRRSRRRPPPQKRRSHERSAQSANSAAAPGAARAPVHGRAPGRGARAKA